MYRFTRKQVSIIKKTNQCSKIKIDIETLKKITSTYGNVIINWWNKKDFQARDTIRVI